MHLECWKTILNNLATKINSEQIKTWILPLQPLSFTNNTLVISSPDIFFQNWIKKNYLQKLIDALKTTPYENTKIEIVLNKNSSLKTTKDILSSFKMPEAISATANTTKTQIQPKEIKKEEKKETREIYCENLNPQATFEHFIVGKHNMIAKSACEQAIKNPGTTFNPIIIKGPTGVGKTHLLQAICHTLKKDRKKVAYLSSEKFTNDFVLSLKEKKTNEFRAYYRNTDFLLIDDIHFLANKKSTQSEFFHTFNELYNDGKQIIITSDRPLDEINDFKEQLLSRFKGGLIVDITEPCLETKLHILMHKSHLEGLTISEKILKYVAEKISTSNIRTLEGIIKKIKAYMAFSTYPLNIETVEKLLGQYNHTIRPAKINLEKIIDTTCAHFKANKKDITATTKNKKHIQPRYMAIYLSRKLTNSSLEEIGNFFGNRSNSSIICVLKKTEEKLSQDKTFSQDLKQLETQLAGILK